VDLKASGPGGSASDSWTFDGGVNEEVTDLFYAPILGEPAEHDVAIDVQNDPPPGTGSSAFYLEMKDTTPPEIRNVSIWQDGEGGVYVEAQVVDNCAVGSVLLIYGSSSGDGGATGMGNLGGDSYGAAVTLPRVGLNSYTIVAVDMAGNASTWGTSMQASYSGAFGWNVFKDGCPPGACGSEGEPVNTASGNFTYHTEDLRVPGVGETDIAIERGYNSQSVPPQGDFETPGMVPGPFGPGWTFPFDFHLEFVDNLLLSGVKVHYPDGRTARFEENGDGTFTALSPGVYDTLTESDGGYVLEKKNLTEYHFDDAGRLVQIVDPNGNTVDLTYDGAGQLARVENSAGRWIELAYNAGGLISDICAPEEVHLRYAYTDGLLTSFTDARGQTWSYTYNPEGWLTSIVTPKGHPSLRLRYGEDREEEDFGRVVEQIEGAVAARTFSYDDAAHTRTILDANGNRTTHRYDADYRLVEVTDARGYSEHYDYDEEDRRVYFQDEEGREWTYGYDDRGNLIHEEGPQDWERAWSYNEQDRLILARDPLSRTTRYGYDQFGNPTVVTNALGLTSTTTTYDQRGLPVRVTDFAGHAISNTYDLQGDLVAVENGVGAVTRYAHDGLGRTTAMTNPRGFVYTYTYAGGSRLMSDLYGPSPLAGGTEGGLHERYGYDPNGNLVEEVDPNGHATTYTYDESENLVAETDPLSHTTVYTYGPMNHLVAMEDAEGRVTTYQYDAVYNLSAEHAPEDAITRYEYDGVGNLVAETDPEGRVTRYVYDALDRMVEQVRNYRPGEPPGPDVNVTTHYEYDLAGNLVQVTSPPDGAHVSRLTFYEYDALDRMVAEVRNYRPGEPPGPDVNVTTTYEYDPNGNLIRRVNPRGYATAYEYDPADRLIAVTDALSQTTTYAYDPNGNLLQVTDRASRLTFYEYDALDRRTAEIRNYRPGEPSSSDVNVTTRYEYDRAGNLRFVTDPRGVVTEYRYDAADRRVRQIQNAAPGEPHDGNTNVTTVYEYDDVGNLVRMIDPNGHPTTYTYDGLNRLVATTDAEEHTVHLGYDRVGNLTERVDARGYATTYAYDGLNRPITVTDALSGTTISTYDAVGNLLTRTDANGHTTAYTYDGLYRVQTVTDAEGHTTAYEYDAGGNRTALIDGNGHRTESTYDPLDRLATVTNAEGETTHYEYDRVGTRPTW
jgi:YD repeat-containing protein